MLRSRTPRAVLLSSIAATLLASSGAARAAPTNDYVAQKLTSTGDAGSGARVNTLSPNLFTGSFTYSIPLATIPGRAGMEPELFLTYRSGAGNSWTGIGWSLELGAVERGTHDAVDYSGDEFVLKDANGSVDLIPVGGGEYRAKIEGAFTRVKKLVAADGSPYFEATDRSGIRYQYGYSRLTRQDDPASASRVFRWCLDRVDDPNGNAMFVSYVKSGGEIYPRAISYTGRRNPPPPAPAGTPVPPDLATKNVWFNLEPRTDVSQLWVAGFKVTTAQRLRSIDIKVNDVVQRSYTLSYAQSSGTGRSLLAQVAQSGTDPNAGPLPVPTFGWASQSRPTEGFVSSYGWDSWANGQRIFNRWWSANFDGDNSSTLRFADVNGDGRVDACVRNDNGLQCYLATANGFAYAGGYDSNATGQSIFSNWSDMQGYGGYDGDNVQTMQLADVNGDGKADACMRMDYGVQCWLSNGAGWSGAISSPIFANEWGCVDYGDGYVACGYSTPVGWDTLRFPDVNGDGRGDACMFTAAGLRCYLATGTGWADAAGYASLFADYWDQKGWGNWDDDNRTSIQFPDLNGDGRADACIRQDYGLKCYLSTGTGWRYEAGYDTFATGQYVFHSYVDQHGYGNFDGDNWTTLQFPDVTGDGKDDVCLRNDWGLQCYVSSGTGFVYAAEFDSWATGQLLFQRWWDQHGWGTFDGDNSMTMWWPDVNGDGKADPCIRLDSGLQCFLSTGTGWTYSRDFDTWATGTYIFANNSDQHGYGNYDGDNVPSIQFADVTGDGRPDACIRHDYGLVCWPNTTSLDQLKTIANGVGSTVTVSYTPSTAYAQTQLPFVVQLLSRSEVSDGRGGSAATTYSYAGGYYYVPEHDFRGFNYVRVASPPGPSGETVVNETWFHQGDDVAVDANAPNVPLGRTKGKPYRIRITDGAGRLISVGTTSYAADADGAAPWFNPEQQVDAWLYDGAATPLQTRTVYTRDDVGNVIREEHHGDLDPSAPADEYTVTRAFLRDATGWIVDRRSSELTYEGLGTSKQIAGKWFYYDELPVFDPATSTDRGLPCRTAPSTVTLSAGNLTRVVDWLEGGVNPEVRTGYDKYGNVVCVRDPRGYVTTYVHDATFTHTVDAYDALNHRKSTRYYGVDGVGTATGVHGQVWKTIDENGAETVYEYDGWGRKRKVTNPDGYWAQWSYVSMGTVGQQRVRMDNSLGGWSESYTDGLGRPYLERTAGADGKVVVATKAYDARGAVTSESLPRFEGDPYRLKEYRYDAMGRPIQVTVGSYSASGALLQTLSTASSCYSKTVSVQIDDSGHRRRETRDAASNVVKVEEYAGTYAACLIDDGPVYATTTYRYDVLGRLRFVVDAKGNTTELRNDSLGRKVYLHDPDLHPDTNGATVRDYFTYEYDAGGHLSAQVDPKGQRVELDYDEIGRLLRRRTATTTLVTYTYDEATAANPVGRLTTMADGSGTERYDYDRMGRTSRVVKRVSGIDYAIVTASDGLGRPQTITYPGDGEVVTYRYDTAGNLQSVKGSVADATAPGGFREIVYTTYAGYNALGQPARVTYGNGVQTTYEYYDATDSRLKTTRTVNATGTKLLEATHAYDLVGNVTRIDDGVNPSYNRTFTYDALSRLKSATSAADGTLSYDYDELGNLTVKEGITFTIGGARPHAITSSSDGRTYKYDGNGNLVADGDRTIVYDVDNRPISVTRSKKATQFVYDGAGKRVLKTSKANGTTTYVSRLHECTNGVCANYVFAGNVRVALRTGRDVKYYHPDHLGSTALVTSGVGTELERLTYLPWGATRTDIGTVKMNHKFTSQELDGETGLYFYGARYYDPRTGRFITPDALANVYEPQDLSKYAYANNNPLRYTDPSGHNVFDKIGDFFKSKAGRKILLSAAIVVGTVVVVACTGGWGSAYLPILVGELLGAGTGAASAAVAGGGFDAIASGVLLGTVLGGASGALTGPLGVGSSLAKAMGLSKLAGAVATGAINGAINGAAMGATSGFQGGVGSWKAGFWERVAVGMAVGAALGGVMEGFSYKATPQKCSPEDFTLGKSTEAVVKQGAEPPNPASLAKPMTAAAGDGKGIPVGEIVFSSVEKCVEKIANNAALWLPEVARTGIVTATDAAVTVEWDRVREFFRVKNPNDKPPHTPNVPF